MNCKKIYRNVVWASTFGRKLEELDRTFIGILKTTISNAIVIRAPYSLLSNHFCKLPVFICKIGLVWTAPSKVWKLPPYPTVHCPMSWKMLDKNTTVHILRRPFQFRFQRKQNWFFATRHIMLIWKCISTVIFRVFWWSVGYTFAV